MVQSPTPPKNQGFLPLHGNAHSNMSQQPSGLSAQDEHVVNIPLTPMMTNASTGARKDGQTVSGYPHGEDGGDGVFQRQTIGRRRAATGMAGVPVEEEGALTTMGKIYDKILHFSIITRYAVYILPLSLCLLIPILVSLYAAPHATIGGVRMKWFFIWLEIVWCSLWVSKLVAKALPTVFQALVGVISAGVKKYSLVLEALELPLSLVGWAVASLCSFLPLMTRNNDLPADRFGMVSTWQSRLNKVLISCLVTTIIWLGEKLIIRVVSVGYYRRQFETRIKTNKESVRFLSQLYEVSRSLFPEYTEFRDEDYIIHQGLAHDISGMKKTSGSATPMRQLLGNINFVQDKVTSAFGNIAQEVTGNKNILNPNSAYATTIEALRRKVASEALAKRIWMSFVPEGHSALTLADIKEVMGLELEVQAEECFHSLDTDNNGDVSLEEMILHTVHLHNDRSDVAKSMQDVDNAISALDSVLSFIVLIITVLVFVIAQQSSVGTTLAGAGTVLISLSFVFAITAQEILGSCIFLFVKHPYDVGDRVDIDDKKYTVEQISLLYTVLKRVDNNKTTQIPNNVLNTKVLENITRSGCMKEQLTIAVHYDTSLEDIQKLKYELLLFTKENSRDFQPDLEVEVIGINDLDKLILRIEMRHRSNWANESLMLARRNRFMLALVAILRRIPIYAPAAGDPTVGEQGKPMYTVAVSDQIARDNMQKANAEKLAKRWDYEDDSDDEDKYSNSGSTAVGLDSNTTTGHRGPSSFIDRPNTRDGARTLGRPSTESSRREDQVEEVRGLLRRESTQGRRQKAVPGNLNPLR